MNKQTVKDTKKVSKEYPFLNDLKAAVLTAVEKAAMAFLLEMGNSMTRAAMNKIVGQQPQTTPQTFTWPNYPNYPGQDVFKKTTTSDKITVSYADEVIPTK